MPQIIAHCGPGQGPNLQSWPLLAWTDKAGVVTEDHQIPIDLIAGLAAEDVEPATIAEALGTSIKHVAQALSYLRATA